MQGACSIYLFCAPLLSFVLRVKETRCAAMCKRIARSLLVLFNRCLFTAAVCIIGTILSGCKNQNKMSTTPVVAHPPEVQKYFVHFVFVTVTTSLPRRKSTVQMYVHYTHHQYMSTTHTTSICPLHTPPVYVHYTHHQYMSTTHTTSICPLHTPPVYIHYTHHQYMSTTHTTSICPLHTPPVYVHYTHHQYMSTTHTHTTTIPSLPDT